MTLVCVALATLPDADLLVPGLHRTATHSVTATIVVAIVAAAVTARATARRGIGGALDSMAWSAVLMCAAAHGSHILLDWLGQDPSKLPGIQALWPLSNRWFISGWEVFPGEERRHIFTVPAMVHNLKVLAWEMGMLGPVVIALWWIRQRLRRTTPVALR
jgi:membrane-bound metal-dependent hydrolase YbcI (DUF457 family)